MRRALFLLLAPLCLSACIDADVTMDIRSPDQVVVTSDVRFARKVFEMMGRSPQATCGTGTATLTDEGLRCRSEQILTLADLTGAPAARANVSYAPRDLGRAAEVEPAGDGAVRVTLDFARLMREAQKSAAFGDLRALEPMLRKALRGHALTLRVKGQRILNSTGTVDADGQVATFIVPMVAALNQGRYLDSPFISVLTLGQDCASGGDCPASLSLAAAR